MKRAALSLLVLCVALAFTEALCRLLAVDFRGTRRAWRALPVFYRQPTVPVGDIYFRRTGPEDWTGRVLYQGVSVLSPTEKDAYADEQPITAHYDRLGFRNPDELSDWEVVIVGDSFTELGHLPYADLVSTRVGNSMGVRVKNLGTSYTGTLTHDFYLGAYGKAPSTTDAMLLFFEGNDITDCERERSQLDAFRATGRRELRDLDSEVQSSLFVALKDLVSLRQSTPLRANALFGDVPVTVGYAPPGSDDMSAPARRALEDALTDWGRIARSLGLRPWLVYLPCKERVLHGRLKFREPAPAHLVAWHPSNLPDYVRGICDRSGIRFVDTTPPLVDETGRGVLTYNHVVDSHLNDRGSTVVAQTIVVALKAASGSR